MLGQMIILFSFVLLVGICFWKKYKNSKYPPGPFSLPILGHLHLFGNYPERDLMKWEKKYGKIMSCNLGSFTGVALNDYNDIKEAFKEPSFDGRPKINTFSERSFGKPRGIVFNENQEWSEQRRFTMRHLRDFGFGKGGSQENLIKNEIIELIEYIKQNIGNPISTRNPFQTTIFNSLCTMLTGTRYSHDDPKLQTLIHLMSTSMSNPITIGLFMPWLNKLFPKWSRWNLFLENTKCIHEFAKTFLNEHKETLVPGSPRDFTDTYIDEINNTKNSKSSFYQEEGEMSLVVTLMDLFFASTETTSFTLSWAMLYLALKENQRIQNLMYDEILSVVGQERLPELLDRPKMPYVEATIMEIMRCSSLTPLGVWHSTLKDVEFHGYIIPKDTMILPNLYAIHHDPNIWGDPHIFRPERFLKNNMKEIKKYESFIPWSIGRRVCIGDNLAKDEIFLIITCIIQLFTIKIDPINPSPSLDPLPGPFSSPKPHKILFNLRNV